MNDFESVAAATFMSYWPEEMDYQMLIKSLKEVEVLSDDLIEVREPFNGYPGKIVANCIECLRKTLEATFVLKST